MLPWLALLLAVFVCTVALAGYGIYRMLTLSGGVREIRQEASALWNGQWEKELEVKVPSIVFWAGRRVGSFLDLDPDVRDALRTVRGAQVGVYRLHETPTRRQLIELLKASDSAMTRRGWDRVVVVLDRHDLVAVYLPDQAAALDQVRACVMVLSDRELVMASVAGNLEPLMKLAQRHLPERRQLRLSENW